MLGCGSPGRAWATVTQVTEGRRHYRYVGPAHVLAEVRPGSEGEPIGSPSALAAWLTARDADERSEPFTFVIGLNGVLRLAPRRSEHVACAGGEPVLSAGEITFLPDPDGWAVGEVSNQSTGYCPDPSSWPAVGIALDGAALKHPARFTDPIVFRRCPKCAERNLVKDDDFTCAICGEDLPDSWNLDPRDDDSPRAQRHAGLAPTGQDLGVTD